MGNDYECHSGNPERPPVHEVRGTSKGVAKGLDAWVHEYNTKYNTDRPHQSIGGCTPAERFTAGQPDPDPALDLTALPNGAAAATARIGSPDGSPPTASSVRHGSKSASANTDTAELVDVHVTDRLLEFWSGTTYSVPWSANRKGEVRKKRAARPATS